MKKFIQFFSGTPTIAFEEELLRYMESGDLEGLKELIQVKSIDPTLLTKVIHIQQGLPLIVYAAYFNKPDIIRYLNSIGCSVEQTGKNGECALTRACYYKKYDAILELIKLGADINKKIDEFPLVQSVRRGNPQLIEFLLKNGADFTIIYQPEHIEVLNFAPVSIKTIFKRQKVFKERLPFLFYIRYTGLLHKLPNGILKDITKVISD